MFQIKHFAKRFLDKQMTFNDAAFTEMVLTRCRRHLLMTWLAGEIVKVDPMVNKLI